MMMEQTIADTLTGEAVGLLKGLGTALLVASLAWTAIRVALEKVKRPELKWSISITFCVLMVAAAHGVDAVTYGDGPAGWWKAIFYGVLGGFLAPALHEKVVKRWLPFLARDGGQQSGVKPRR